MSAESEPFETLKVIGIIGGLIFSGVAFLLNAYATRRAIVSRKLLNYQELIRSHRDIWKLTLDAPTKYVRILETRPNVAASPITYEERRFVNLLLLHVTSAYYFSKHSDTTQIEKLREDVLDLLSLPIPREIWQAGRHYFNSDFVKFIESPRRSTTASAEEAALNLAYAKRWNILVLTAFPDRLVRTLSQYGDRLIFATERLGDLTVRYLEDNEINLIVSFGYGRILRPAILRKVVGINLHCGYLPYDRGPNPNMWSAIRGTQRGVTVHYLADGVDEGDIIGQRLVAWPPGPVTLQASFDQMVSSCLSLFDELWPEIRAGRNQRVPQHGEGSWHTLKSQLPINELLNTGLDLPIDEFRRRAKELLATSST